MLLRRTNLRGLSPLDVGALLGADAEGVGAEHLDLDGFAAVEVLHALDLDDKRKQTAD